MKIVGNGLARSGEKEYTMKEKKQAALGGALLVATTAMCLKLAKWAGKKIKERTEKKK